MKIKTIEKIIRTNLPDCYGEVEFTESTDRIELSFNGRFGQKWTGEIFMDELTTYINIDKTDKHMTVKEKKIWTKIYNEIAEIVPDECVISAGLIDCYDLLLSTRKCVYFKSPLDLIKKGIFKPIKL